MQISSGSRSSDAYLGGSDRHTGRKNGDGTKRGDRRWACENDGDRNRLLANFWNAGRGRGHGCRSWRGTYPIVRELAYVRSRFLVECVAAGVIAIDCPYTFADLDEAEADLRFARGLGYKAKSIVNAEQVTLVNRLLTPSEEEVDQARRIVEHFEAARSAGRDRIRS